jgi:putative transcriptional regulator
MSDVANSIRRGVEDAVAFARGDRSRGKATVVWVPEYVDVKALRARLGLSQAGFAARYGFSVAAVRDWEQGRRRPEASARVLLTVIDREPEAVERALSAA